MTFIYMYILSSRMTWDSTSVIYHKLAHKQAQQANYSTGTVLDSNYVISAASGVNYGILSFIVL